LRLWTAGQHRHLQEFDDPEIRRVDLAGPILELLAWGEPDPLAIPWFERPATEAVEKSLSILRMLGAVDQNGITTLGRTMARLPVQPRIARLMVEGAQLGRPCETALLGALLSERDLFQRSRPLDRRGANQRRVRHGSDSDLLDLLLAIEEFEERGIRDFELGRIDAGAARFVLKSRDQLLRMLESATNSKSTVSAVSI